MTAIWAPTNTYNQEPITPYRSRFPCAPTHTISHDWSIQSFGLPLPRPRLHILAGRGLIQWNLDIAKYLVASRSPQRRCSQLPCEILNQGASRSIIPTRYLSSPTCHLQRPPFSPFTPSPVCDARPRVSRKWGKKQSMSNTSTSQQPTGRTAQEQEQG